MFDFAVINFKRIWRVHGASYCVVDPAVGDLRSSSVSENAVLHALHARVFPQVPKRRFVFLYLCTHKQKAGTKRISVWSNRRALVVLYDYFKGSGRLDQMAVPHSTHIHNNSPRSHGALQIKTAGCKLKIAAGLCAADSGAEGKICWGETLIITSHFYPQRQGAPRISQMQLWLCVSSLTQPNPGCLSKAIYRTTLLRERFPKAPALEDRVRKVRVKSFQRQFILHEFMYPRSKATTQNPLCFEVWSTCAKKTCVPERFQRNSRR